jgi:nicotinamide-nucleotide amidase
VELVNFEPAVLELSLALRRQRWRMATAESCTGGLIAAACTALAGSSEWFERGFVTYSNAAKSQMLGVDAALIDAHGAVSEAVARAMALGALQRAEVELSVAVTGIAGPAGATPDKPVGLVWLAVARRGATPADAELRSLRGQFSGGRGAVREQSVAAALQLLREALD